MVTRVGTLGAALVAVLVLSGSAAHASTTSLQITSSSDTTWAAATTTQAHDGLQIKIFAPKPASGRRVLWQKCSFSGSYVGTYKCGIDSSKGSLAQKRDGTWVVKVVAGGVRVARTTFTL